MCGIYGWQFKKDKPPLTIYQQTILALTLSQEMETRGRHSFGGAIWRDDGAPEIVKNLGKITETAHQVDLFGRIVTAPRALIHTRHATTGAVTIDNCHPFELGDILGVHNGQVYNHKELCERYERKFDVDSMHIFAHIDEEKDLNELDVYGAIVYAKKSEDFKAFYFGKSAHGSFSVVRLYASKEGADEPDNAIGVIFASENRAIRMAIDRLGMEGREIVMESEKLYSLEDGYAYDLHRKLLMSTKYSTTPSRTTGARSDFSYVKVQGDNDNTASTYQDGSAGLTYNDPVAHNIRAAARFPVKNTWVNGIQVPIRMCTCCWHPLGDHIMGWCTDPHCSRREVCNIAAPLCNSCGCYLVDCIHRAHTINGQPLVYCSSCESDCTVKPKLSKKDKKKAKKELKKLKSEQQATSADDVSNADEVSDEEQTAQTVTQEDVPCETKMCPNVLMTETSLTYGTCSGCREEYAFADPDDENVSRCRLCELRPLITPVSIRLKICAWCRYPENILKRQAARSVSAALTSPLTGIDYGNA